MDIKDKLENVIKHYNNKDISKEDEVLLIRANWVRIMELTRMKVDPRSPVFKKIKKELKYRSWIMEEWGFVGRIPDDYKEPVEGMVFVY